MGKLKVQNKPKNKDIVRTLAYLESEVAGLQHWAHKINVWVEEVSKALSPQSEKKTKGGIIVPEGGEILGKR